MIKLLLITLATLVAFADNITLSHAHVEKYGERLLTNAKITQLSNQKQTIVSILGGHIEKYFIEPGQEVKKGDPIALIQSLDLSRMTAEYLSLSQQIKAAAYDLASAEKLFKKGVGSKLEYNEKLIALQEIKSKRNTLKSQLSGLGIDPASLTKATDALILHAHADGVVGEMLVPLHTTVDAQTPLVTLINESSYYALAYISPKDALDLTPDTKGWISVAGKQYPCSFTQLLPEVDAETQRAQVLFQIVKNPKRLLLNAYVSMEIILPPFKEAVTVKKSVLTLFNGEWVVFVPTEEAHEEGKETGHEEHGKTHEKEHEEASAHEAHEDDAHEAGEEGHGHEAHEAAPYEPRVIEVLSYNGEEAALKGLKNGEEYVSDGVYFVKSLLLKSSLGEHGH